MTFIIILQIAFLYIAMSTRAFNYHYVTCKLLLLQATTYLRWLILYTRSTQRRLPPFLKISPSTFIYKYKNPNNFALLLHPQSHLKPSNSACQQKVTSARLSIFKILGSALSPPPPHLSFPPTHTFQLIYVRLLLYIFNVPKVFVTKTGYIYIKVGNQ